MKWTKKNKVRMTPTTFRDWRAEIPSSGTTDTTTSGTDTYKSKSQGDLTVTGGLDKQSAEVSVDDAPPLVLGNQGAAQPASPVSPSPYKGKGIFGLDINQRIKNYVTGQN